LPSQLQRASTADAILEQFEHDRIADAQVTERRALAEVASMEVDFASVGEPDESVALTDEQFDDLSDRAYAARLDRLGKHWKPGRRRRRGAAT
jgi:hypothetical protein